MGCVNLNIHKKAQEYYIKKDVKTKQEQYQKLKENQHIQEHQSKLGNSLNSHIHDQGEKANTKNNVVTQQVHNEKFKENQNINEESQKKILLVNKKKQDDLLTQSNPNQSLKEKSQLANSKNIQLEQIVLQINQEKTKTQLINTNNIQIAQTDIFLMNELGIIQKDLFASNIYLWIDQDIKNPQNQKTLLLLKNQGFNPILYKTIEQGKNAVTNNKSNSRFRIITSALIAEAVCKQFKSNQKVVHIYIYGGQKSVGQALKKKERKIKFYAGEEQEFIKNIKQKSHYDNKFIDLPNFLKITNKNNDHDNTMINKSRYNLHGLLRFKNRTQAKNDFIKIAKYFYSVEDKAFKYQIEQFQNEYPIQLNLQLILNWYTRPTFFYGFLNNMLRTTSNPLQTAYLRHPFESTFKAIKTIYDQTQKRSFKVYRGGFINNQQLKYLEQNVGQYIQMYGFVSTSEDYTVAESFRQRYNGNSLMTILIQNQDRQVAIDYGYVSLVEYSDLPSEKQVLFNSLNVFKIISYTRQDGINKVTLKYGELARMVKLGLDKVPQKQKNIIYNYKHQQEIISKHIHNQADVFKYCQIYDSELKYRQHYIKQYQHQQTIQFADQLHMIGLVYFNKSDSKKALQYYQRSLKIKQNILGENNISTADTLQNIGQAYYNKVQYNHALQYYQRSLKVYLNILGENHISTAMSLQNIGIVHESKNDYIKALQYYQRSLMIKMEVLGENHSSTADTLSNIGIVFRNLTEYNKALEFYQRSLKIKLKILGEYHSSTAITLQNIGNVYYNQNEYKKALQYYQRSLKINMSIFGENHSSTAATFRNIGLLYYSQMEYQKAQQLFNKCYQIRLKIYGPNHDFTTKVNQNIKVCKRKSLNRSNID